MKKFIQTSMAAILVGAALFTTGCNTAKQESVATFDLVAAKQEIQETNNNLTTLLSKKDSVAIANDLYTADAKFFGQNQAASVGTAQLQSLFNAFVTAGYTFELTTAEVLGNENALVEEGTYVINANGQKVDTGKYIAVWKKQDGKWKIYRDCPSSDLPVEGSK
jgi:ketosteroid isomerase-like protein